MDKIKVFLVDDHPVVREGLRTMLSTSPDIEVVGEAGDGLEAVEKAGEHQPNVVLMDLRMPNMDGLEATRRIKSQLPSIAVILLTMYDNEAYIVSAIKAGAGGYLLKDASKDLLVHTIRAVNSGGMLIRSSLLREALAPEANLQGDLLPGRPIMHAHGQELTAREQEVLRLVAQGKSNKETGRTLFISQDTVKKHVQNIILKMGVSDRTQAAVKAVYSGLLDPPYNKKG